MLPCAIDCWEAGHEEISSASDVRVCARLRALLGTLVLLWEEGWMESFVVEEVCWGPVVDFYLAQSELVPSSRKIWTLLFEKILYVLRWYCCCCYCTTTAAVHTKKSRRKHITPLSISYELFFFFFHPRSIYRSTIYLIYISIMLCVLHFDVSKRSLVQSYMVPRRSMPIAQTNT